VRSSRFRTARVVDSNSSGVSSSFTDRSYISLGDHLGTNGAPDQLLATTTQPITIPWRPAVYAFNGIAFNATFDMSSLGVMLPNNVIIGVAYNTADYGAAPIGVPGPYNSLNVGVPTGQTASVGTDDNPDNVFWNTSFAGFYSDGGALRRRQLKRRLTPERPMNGEGRREPPLSVLPMSARAESTANA
jgi:hypothetical protein